VIENSFLRSGVGVDDENSFQERTAAEHIQHGSDWDLLPFPHIFQREVYKIWDSELTDGDGELTNKKFAERREVLPGIFRLRLFAFLSSCSTRIYVKPFHRWHGETEEAT
jgi:hypothetical protein